MFNFNLSICDNRWFGEYLLNIKSQHEDMQALFLSAVETCHFLIPNIYFDSFHRAFLLQMALTIGHFTLF